MLFNGVLANKKEGISNFMMDNYSGEAKSRISFFSSPQKKADDFNYQPFLNKYIRKNENGEWTRRIEMWDGDKNKGFTPKTSSK